MKRIVVGITGASSMLYAKRILFFLQQSNVEIHLIISHNALSVIEQESKSLTEENNTPLESIQQYASHIYPPEMFSAPVASGSFLYDGVILIPCSMNTIAHIAHGITNTLIHRVVDVCIKERRTVVAVPRETPLSTIHLANMLSLSQQGVYIMPPSPALYMNPSTMLEVVDIFVLRILDIFHIPHTYGTRWGE